MVVDFQPVEGYQNTPLITAGAVHGWGEGIFLEEETRDIQVCQDIIQARLILSGADIRVQGTTSLEAFKIKPLIILAFKQILTESVKKIHCIPYVQELIETVRYEYESKLHHIHNEASKLTEREPESLVNKMLVSVWQENADVGLSDVPSLREPAKRHLQKCLEESLKMIDELWFERA